MGVAAAAHLCFCRARRPRRKAAFSSQTTAFAKRRRRVSFSLKTFYASDVTGPVASGMRRRRAAARALLARESTILTPPHRRPDLAQAADRLARVASSRKGPKTGFLKVASRVRAATSARYCLSNARPRCQ